MMMPTAYFVKQPSRFQDLLVMHADNQEKPYEVVKTIELPQIDYESFTRDFTVNRQFLEDNYALCSVGSVYRCLLIKWEFPSDGILVIPRDRAWVGWAAYKHPPRFYQPPKELEYS